MQKLPLLGTTVVCALREEVFCSLMVSDLAEMISRVLSAAFCGTSRQRSVPNFFHFSNVFAFSYAVDYGILFLLLVLPEYSEGGEADMEGFTTSFLLSILASIIAYYICKWLEKQNKQ